MSEPLRICRICRQPFSGYSTGLGHIHKSGGAAGVANERVSAIGLITIKARFESICPLCGEPLPKGEYCAWNTGHPAMHFDCAADVAFEMLSDTI